MAFTGYTIAQPGRKQALQLHHGMPGTASKCSHLSLVPRWAPCARFLLTDRAFITANRPIAAIASRRCEHAGYQCQQPLAVAGNEGGKREQVSFDTLLVPGAYFRDSV